MNPVLFSLPLLRWPQQCLRALISTSLGAVNTGRWARESLVEAFVAYLSASFDISAACSRAIRLRSNGAATKDLEALEERTEMALHEVQMSTVKRIRLLSTAEATKAAQTLHEEDHAFMALAFKATDIPNADQIAAVKNGLWNAREIMFNEARRALQLRTNAEPPVDLR